MMTQENLNYGVSPTYEFVIVCITDSGTIYEQIWSGSYDNAVSAVMAYSGFSDHATCVLDRVVTLVEPNGRSHVKVFKYPYGSVKEYEAACERLRKSDRLLSSNQG
jgi:hypothetical protein